MRRFVAAITSCVVALGLVTHQFASGAVPSYDSAYQFESAFLSLKAGDSGTFSVFFANTGATSWVAGSGTQVNLAVCAADKVTCNVPSANAAWADGWLSTTAYATATKSVVPPGDFSAFTYKIKAPTNTAAGTYRFNGDLVLASSGATLHPEGYYQDATTTAGAPPPAFGGGGGSCATCGTGTSGTTGTTGTTGMTSGGVVIAGIATNIVSTASNIARLAGEWLFGPPKTGSPVARA
jgi:hypothetical protein